VTKEQGLFQFFDNSSGNIIQLFNKLWWDSISLSQYT